MKTILALTLLAAVWSTTASAAEALPDVTLTDVEQQPIRLSDLRGRVVLLDLCASWCIVCRESLPYYTELQRQHADAVTVVAVSIDEDADDARAFARTLPKEVRFAHDPDRKGADVLGMRAMPTLLIVDRQGRIRLRHESYRPEDKATIEKVVAELIAEP